MQAENFYQEIEPFKDKLYRFALKILGNTFDAEDILQEALIKIWKKKEQFAEIENKEAWCMTVVRNMAFDKIRSNKRKQTVDIADQFDVSDKTESVQLSIEKREMVDRIKREIAKLPEKQREVMYLRDIEGYTYKEIEQMTEYTLDQIKINIFRARQYIRKALGSKRNIA